MPQALGSNTNKHKKEKLQIHMFFISKYENSYDNHLVDYITYLSEILTLAKIKQFQLLKLIKINCQEDSVKHI